MRILVEDHWMPSYDSGSTPTYTLHYLKGACYGC